jgi:hypothetical protein
MRSSTGWNCGLSPRCPAVTISDRGRWAASKARCSLVVNPPRGAAQAVVGGLEVCSARTTRSGRVRGRPPVRGTLMPSSTGRNCGESPAARR